MSPEHGFGRGKSFGKLLAYLSGQVAVIASQAVDHPLFFRNGDNGLLPAHDMDAWAEAIVNLLEQPDVRCRMAIRGWEDFRQRLGSATFAGLLDSVLRKHAGLALGGAQSALLASCALRDSPRPPDE